MKHESTSTKKGTTSQRLRCLFVLMLGLSASANAQNSSTTSGTTPLGITPGAPAGSYSLSGFESVNPYNGALNFRLPLLHVGGRGGVGHTIQFVSEQHWRVDKNPTATIGYVYDPNPNWWSTLDAGFSLGTMVGRRTGISQANGAEVYCPDPGTALTRFTFTAADGTEYEFRDVQSNGAPMENRYQIDPNNEFICNLVTTHTRGRVFVTSDGSAATFISDLVINDHSDNTDPYSSLPGELAYPTGYLFMRDGTCYRIDGGKVPWIRDRNGNRITFQYEYIGPNWRTTITDSLNRVVVIEKRLYDPVRNQEYDLITYKGFGGAARTIKLWYSQLKFALRPDFGTQAKTYEFLFPALDGSAQTPFNPKLVAEIELPDGRKYFLRYNYYGELAQVDLPTGGRIEYDYDAGVTGGDPTGVVTGISAGGSVKNIYRRVTERRIYKDAGTTLELKETYSRPENNSGGNQGYVQVQHLAADGVTILARERHFYFGSPKSSFVKNPYEYSNWKDGKEYQTKLYDKGPSGALLRLVESTWQQPADGNTWPLTGQGETSDTAKPNQPQITAVTTTLSDTDQVSKQTFTYDKYTNRTEVKEYDLGPSAPGSLVRRTATSYVTNNLSVDYTTVNPNTSSPDPNATVHIRSLPLQQSVYDSASTEKARSTYEYDNYTGGLWDRSDITGHARMLGAQATHTASYFTRGNTTLTTNVVLGTPDVLLSTRMQYDIAGNVRSVTDPKTSTTTLEFNDRFGTPDDEAQDNTQAPIELGSLHTYAFATKVTNAVSHVTYTQYDYYLGKPVNGEDANGAVAKGLYDDDLDRATELVVGIFTGSQLRRRTQFIYDDPAKTITTQSDQTTYDDQAFKAVSLYDGLGRTFETRSYETGSAYIITKQEFDGLGRVKRSYNPFRTTSDDTYGYADTTYDGLGRATKVETFNASATSTGSVTTAYSGNATTVTDQATKQRRSITDGLGRLTRVDEPDSTGNLDNTANPPQPLQPTSYLYDVLDNLAKVTQGGQSRFFMYDSLKRLIRARNPEQDTNASLALTDPLTSNSQWCMKYTYDDNSNLLTKTDPRGTNGLTTTYAYDALNRVTSRTYTNDPQNTPPVNYVYDSQPLPTGQPPSFDRGSSVGRLVAVTYGGASAGTYRGYDSVGRVVRQVQQTDGINYQVDATYDRAGELKSETYPAVPGFADRRTVNFSYDTAGRMNSLSSAATSYASGANVSGVTYSAHGGLASETYGSGLVHAMTFNSRLQPDHIKLGTTGAPTSILDLAYGYAPANANNGNVQSIIYNGGGLSYTQTFSYDNLNRLLTSQENNGASWSQTNAYDRYGNRWTVSGGTPSLTFDSNNRIVGFTYDQAGNLTNDGSLICAYDAESRLSGADYYYSPENPPPPPLGGPLFTAVYDGEGNRVRKQTGMSAVAIGYGADLRFVYDMFGRLILEINANANTCEDCPTNPLNKEYIYGVSGLAATIEPYFGTSYLTPDHLGSPRVVTNATQSVVSRHDYMAFGEELSEGIGGRTAGMGYGGIDGVRKKFTQKERDFETGLDYFLARYYSSAQGRFTSPDEFTGGPDDLFDFVDDASDNPTFYADLYEPQSLNKYQYCLNSPLIHVDPDGHQDGAPYMQMKLARALADVSAEAAVNKKLDQAQLVISGVGFAPGLGDAADLVNAGVSLARGNPTDAAFDTLGALPFVGSFFSAGRRAANAIRKADDVVDTASDLGRKTPHGNSASSTKPQHGYEIVDQKGDVKKVGVSGQRLNQDRTSPRANPQVNKANKTGTNQVTAVIRQRSVKTREQILKWEKKQAEKRKKEGHSMDMHKRP